MILRARLVLILCLLMLAHQAIAATPVYDAIQTSQGSGVSSLNWPLTVGGGCVNAFLEVSVSWDNSPVGTITGITYGGVPLTFIAAQTQVTDTTLRLEMWRLVAPTTGSSQSVAVTFDSNKGDIAAEARSYCNVHQTTPMGTPVTASNTNTTPTVTVSSAAGELVIDAAQTYSTTLTVGAGQTQRGNVSNNDILGVSDEAGAASVVMSWAAGVSRDWSIIAVPLKPTAAAAAVRRPFSPVVIP